MSARTTLKHYIMKAKHTPGHVRRSSHVERIHKDGDGDASFQLKSDSITTWHRLNLQRHLSASRFKNHESSRLKTKTSAQTMIYKSSFKDIIYQEIVSKASI
ncbi:hypothetical protein Tco_0480264 [Tanacetum coccineum]